MSGKEKRGSQRRDFAMAIEAQVNLYQALKAHKFDLEIARGVSALDDEILACRIEATQRLLELLEQALEIEPTASPAVQAPASLPNPPSRRWISHSGDTPTDLVV
jgi:hypothetical protein